VPGALEEWAYAEATLLLAGTRIHSRFPLKRYNQGIQTCGSPSAQELANIRENTNLTSCFQYLCRVSPACCAWEPLQSLPNHLSVLQIFIYGGQQSSTSYLDSVETLDTRWAATACASGTQPTGHVRLL
jgi:hypothetical protein